MQTEVIEMGKYFTFPRLINKLRELKLLDLFSKEGEPVCTKLFSGVTKVSITHSTGRIEKNVNVVQFVKYDWRTESLILQETIFDSFSRNMCRQNVCWHYVLNEQGQLATTIIIMNDTDYKYAYVQ